MYSTILVLHILNINKSVHLYVSLLIMAISYSNGEPTLNNWICCQTEILIKS